ncbi:MAG TPA: SurA N-terminal domain-containing protein [Coxiellaceae bacterium]|nr:SurA N-terminal domain-containing protein [Coxiellaceae bacterium]
MFRLLITGFLVLCFSVVRAEPLDKIVAVVNDQVITQSQLDLAVNQINQQIAQANAPNPPSPSVIREDALNQLINQSLQVQLAEKANIKITDAELQQAISSIAQQNHISVAELTEKVTSETGLSMTQFKQQIKQQIMVTKLQQMALGSKIDITEAQVNNAVRKIQTQQQDSSEYNISDILIPLPEDPSEAQLTAAKKEAADLIVQLNAGKTVSELITETKEPVTQTESEKAGLFTSLFNSFKKKSDSELSSTDNPNLESEISAQDLGWRKKTDLPEVFASELNTLKKSKVAGPIHTANGLHILFLNEYRTPTSLTIDRLQVRNQLYQEALMKELEPWLKQVRKTAYIKINP